MSNKKSQINLDSRGMVVEKGSRKTTTSREPSRSSKTTSKAVANGVGFLLGAVMEGAADAVVASETAKSVSRDYERSLRKEEPPMLSRRGLKNIEEEVDRILDRHSHYDECLWDTDLRMIRMDSACESSTRDEYVYRQVAYSLIFISIEDYCGDGRRHRNIPVEYIRKSCYRLIDMIDRL